MVYLLPNRVVQFVMREDWAIAEGICKVCKSELYLDEDNILKSLKVFKEEERQKSPEKMAQAVADAKKSGDYTNLPPRN